MIEFENYKKNLNLIDKPGVTNVVVNKAVSYSGNLECIKIKKSDEESDPNQPLAAAIIGINNTDAPLPSDTKCYTTWTDIDAQELYLSTKPACYLMLSKPGAGAHSLGEALSKILNCIHLCPQNMILDEIEQKSPTGMCIDFNMRHNKAITFEMFFKILEMKLESLAIQHRGYIISGFPLVTSSRFLKYLVNKLHGEEAVEVVDGLLFETIANLKKKKPKKPKGSISSPNTSELSEVFGEDEEIEEEPEPEELPEEEEELKVELPKFVLDACSDIIHPINAYYNSKKNVLLEQLNNLFSLKLKPDIIIYLSCPDMALVTKKAHKYLNYKTNRHVVEPFLISSTTEEVRWPVKYTTSDYTNPVDAITFDSKYCCRMPINFEDNSVDQMCNYKKYIFPFIEKKLKDFDPKSVVWLDARLTLHELIHNVTERLLMMPIIIKPVRIPQPLYMEEPPDDMEELWESIEERNVINSGVVAFKKTASLWANRCPVELKKRISVKGNSKFAVMFSKHVYLLASLDNMISFCRNPRPYLKLKYLEPTCRIIVIGTKCSGKTMISECLSWLFDTPIINYNDFLQTEKQKKYISYAKTVLSEIIPTIEDARLVKWQSADDERVANLKAWCSDTIKKLKKYIPLLKEYIKFKEYKEFKVGEEGEEIDEEAPNFDLLNDFNHVRSDLSFLSILDDLDACQNALSIEGMAQYAPSELTTKIEKPALPIIGDKDVMEAIDAYIVSNDLQKELEPTREHLMDELTMLITSIDAESQIQTNFDQMYGKYIIDGFPSDPECWTILTESKLLPDYTVALIENKEIETELIDAYKVIENAIKIYHKRYMLAQDPLITTKLKTKKPPRSMPADIHKNTSHDFINLTLSTENIEETDEWAKFAENVEKFKEDWDSIKIKLEDANKCYIDIELEEKSDIQVVEEVLLKLRKCYCISCKVIDGEEDNEEDDEDDNEDEKKAKDVKTYNNPQAFGETGIYCPIAFYNHGVLWEGKPEFSLKFDNKLYRFCKEDFSVLFQNDVTKYQSYNKPFKALPPLRICVIGCIGSGKTTISKLLAKELGLMHIDFAEAVNDWLLPKHFKKVGRQYENPFTDVPIDDEAVIEFQVDEQNENLISDIMSNETELRRMVNNYFERGAALLPQLMQRLIKKIWFQDPFLNTGFILDGYPRLPTDVEDMTSCYCIPDLIIEIEGSSDSALQRLSSKMFQTWKMQLNEAKEKARQQLAIRREEWMNFLTKTIVAKLICEEILENMFFSSEPIRGLSHESIILDADPTGTVVEVGLFQLYNEMIEEFPEPKDQSSWEKADEAREKIDSRIEGIYESDDENIQALKDILTEERIKTVAVDGNKSLVKVSRVALSKLTNLRNRCESFFEQTYITNPDIAEVLLLQGFVLLSKFNRVCPVHVFENPKATQNIYKSYKQKNQVFPIIHRSYIYFVCGEESLKKFRINPLKFVTCMCGHIEYPLRIAVIGAPKSGRSSLSAKLAQRYGLMCLSRGIAVRSVLQDKLWTKLAGKLLSPLSLGDCVNLDYVMRAVQTLVMDHRTMTNGFVLDGFPESAAGALELDRDGLYPNLIFDISADMEKVVENSQNEIHYDILKRNPPYSRPFIEHRYRKWEEKTYSVREWLNDDYQNVYVLDGNKSRWQCFQDAINIINDFVPKVHHYLSNVQTTAVPAYVMCISNEVFKSRMSNFKNMCPLCLRKNVLKHNAHPTDKKGVIQYNNTFYWICPEHFSSVLKTPHSYLKSQCVDIPEIPTIVNTVNLSLVYENGVCIVTYAEHLPAQKIIVGTNKFAASYKENTYLFCSKACLDKFLAKPHMYFDITVFKEAKLFPPLSLQKLPHVGYLEQTVGNLITEACCSVNVLRPKYPGLSFQLSAFLHIALYLKSHNPRTDKAALPLYMKAGVVYEARCRILPRVALFLRSIDNPFTKYPVCCVPKSESAKAKKPTSRVPVPDERYDYLVEYHKPASKVPAFLNVVDIAGLVKGAAEGQGLGNAFLSHIKACDAIFNLCRAFDDEDVIHVDGDVNPVRDLETIAEELRLKDEEQLLANFDKLDRVVQRGGDKKLKPEYDALTRIKAVLVDEKKHIRFGDWSAADIEVLNKYLFLTSKPALYLVNLSEKDYTRKKNKWLPKLKEWIDKNDPGAPLIPFSGVLETKLMEMDPEERKAYLKEHNITSALEKIIVQGYKALNLEYFFTAGADEVKAWTIQKGTKAPQAAGRIHTDFEKGFIMAEVMHYKDFKEEGSEAACKSAGKYRQQGRNYVVEDGDIIFFKFNAGAGLKDAKKK